MNRTLILFFLFLFFSSFCCGQILIGINGGYNFSVPCANSNGNPHHDADLSVDQNSFLVSAFLKSRLPKKVVNIGCVAEYYTTGLTGLQSIGGNGSGTIYNYDFTLDFFNIIIKPEFVFGSKWRFIINSGVYFGILLHVNTTGTWETYGPYSVTSGIIHENTNHYFQYLNFGFLVGMGTEYPVTDRIIVNFEVNYTLGLTSLANSSLSEVYYNLLNTQISVGLAYKFNWARKTDKEKKKTDWYDV